MEHQVGGQLTIESRRLQMEATVNSTSPMTTELGIGNGGNGLGCNL